jgi:hypothetical protein
MNMSTTDGTFISTFLLIEEGEVEVKAHRWVVAVSSTVLLGAAWPQPKQRDPCYWQLPAY